MVCDPSMSKTALPTGVPICEGGDPNPGRSADVALLPRLGFCSCVISGTGEYVLSVDEDTAAARIGLQPGDVILALNEQRLAREGDWDQAMLRAARNGMLTLRVREGQTGNVAHRRCRVFSTAWAAMAVA
jgi:membrane-associated protease RseP (regulator of RpoE activity)